MPQDEMSEEMVLVSKKTISRLFEQATRVQRGCTDHPEHLKRDLEFIAAGLQSLLPSPSTDKSPWFEITLDIIRAAARQKWGAETEVSEPYWIDPVASLLRVGIDHRGVSFGACFNYRTRKFE